MKIVAVMLMQECNIVDETNHLRNYKLQSSTPWEFNFSRTVQLQCPNDMEWCYLISTIKHFCTSKNDKTPHYYTFFLWDNFLLNESAPQVIGVFFPLSIRHLLVQKWHRTFFMRASISCRIHLRNDTCSCARKFTYPLTFSHWMP